VADSKSIYHGFTQEEAAAAASRERKDSPARIIERWQRAMGGDPSKLGEAVDLAGYTENCLGLTGWTTGFQTAFANLQKNMFAPWKDMTRTVEEVVVGETTIVMRERDEATHVGEFLGIPATGRRVAWDAIAIIHTREGRVVGMWAQADLHGIYLQLTK
jgi:predicted ester cyclase